MLDGVIANALAQLAHIVSAIAAPAPAAPPPDMPAPPAVVTQPETDPTPPVIQQVLEERTVSSTAYCLPGPTWGTVAMNDVPKGTRWHILNGSRADDIVTVADRIGWGSDFDLWYDNCRDAKNYGRQKIRIVRLPD
jgi:hypothetical protein